MNTSTFLIIATLFCFFLLLQVNLIQSTNYSNPNINPEHIILIPIFTLKIILSILAIFCFFKIYVFFRKHNEININVTNKVNPLEQISMSQVTIFKMITLKILFVLVMLFDLVILYSVVSNFFVPNDKELGYAVTTFYNIFIAPPLLAFLTLLSYKLHRNISEVNN